TGSQTVASIRGLTLLNQARRSAGLTPLALNPQLPAAAQAHTDDLVNASAKMGALGHNGSDGSTPLVRILRAGYHTYSWGSYYGENWAAFQTIDQSMKFWLADPPHRANILRPRFREIGIGITITT